MRQIQDKNLRFAFLVTAYYVAARLGLLLAIPPGYATTVWPASGVALAGLLAWGGGYWPAIWLASFIVNASTSADPGQGGSLVLSLGIAAAIASGAALQAYAGCALIRRFVGPRLELIREIDIAKFMILAGPVSCVINATLAVSVLALSHRIPWSQYGEHWWTWWTGDALGVLDAAPLLMIELLEPRELWAKRRITVGVPLLLLFILTMVSFVHVSRLEREKARSRFETRAEVLQVGITEKFDQALEVVRSLGSFYKAVGGVDRQLFKVYAGSLEERHPWLQALTWNLAVVDEGRSAVESAGRRSGFPDFRFYELNSQGKSVTAPRRRDYVVTIFARPRPENAKQLGYNVDSDPVLRDAMRKSKKAGRAVAASRILPGTDKASRDSLVWLPRPVFDDSESARKEFGKLGRLKGYISASFTLSQLMESVFNEYKGQPLSVVICDADAVGGERVLWCNDEGLFEACASTQGGAVSAPETGLGLVKPMAWAFRNFHVIFRAPMDKDFALRAWGPWSVMALGMLFTALMGSFLLAATGRSVVIQRMAVERARDMADANEALRKEVIERKNAEVTLRKRDAELLQAQKMEVVGRLSGGVAHDFNNMLTVILGSAKLAQQESGLPPVLGAYLSDIESAGEKAADLTQRLLAMSRKQVLAPRILDLNQLVQESEALIRRVVSEEVELKVVLAKQDNLVHADWAQLQQAVINLAINARDAMPKGGRIEMGVHRLEIVEPDPLAFPGMKPGIWEEFYVKDSGSGIDPEILPHIFEPFFTTKDKGKGTGLGLAMVYGIVTQSGGVLDVKTTLGQGSTFSIRLPHAEDAPLGVSSGPHPGPFAPAESGSRSGTLLLVEDDEQVRKLLTEVLTRRGYKVLQAGGGGEALEILKHRKSELSLMISDMMMPGLGGRDLAREATVLAPGMPILLVSGYTEPMDFAQEFGPGAHFMPKPLAPDALLAKVAEILGPKA